MYTAFSRSYGNKPHGHRRSSLARLLRPPPQTRFFRDSDLSLRVHAARRRRLPGRLPRHDRHRAGMRIQDRAGLQRSSGDVPPGQPAARRNLVSISDGYPRPQSLSELPGQELSGRTRQNHPRRDRIQAGLHPMGRRTLGRVDAARPAMFALRRGAEEIRQIVGGLSRRPERRTQSRSYRRGRPGCANRRYPAAGNLQLQPAGSERKLPWV
ncbi:hypothetical protein SDC9_126106 [bioreactor metagenome]|uniref:Uncharacterized protein n=1 Tax=bioreactor metagenome TaxID=1076179 RepID=A0A645CQ97_9ZZZZ